MNLFKRVFKKNDYDFVYNVYSYLDDTREFPLVEAYANEVIKTLNPISYFGCLRDNTFPRIFRLLRKVDIKIPDLMITPSPSILWGYPDGCLTTIVYHDIAVPAYKSFNNLDKKEQKFIFFLAGYLENRYARMYNKKIVQRETKMLKKIAETRKNKEKGKL